MSNYWLDNLAQHCHFGLLPKCLQNGSNPGDIIEDEDFPIYIGGAGAANLSCFIHDLSIYQNGVIGPTDNTGTTDIGNIILSNYPWPTWTESSTKSIELWVYVNVAIVGPGATFFILNDQGASPNLDVVRLFIKTVGGGNDRIQTTFVNNYNTNPFLNKAGGATTFGGELFHLVFVKDGTTIKLFINAVEETYALTANYSGDFTENPSTTQFLTYHNDNYPSATHRYESIIFYDKALSDAEILQNYNNKSDLGGLRGYANASNTLLTLRSEVDTVNSNLDTIVNVDITKI